MKKEKIVLCIMDGFGIRDEKYGNAIKNASTPNLDHLFNTYPSTLLEASEEHVGLPSGQMGNSEVGHMNIGAGRVVYQSLTLINKMIKEDKFAKNEKFIKALNHVKTNKSTLHLLILLSDGGVHSHIEHLFSMIEAAKNNKVKNVHIHLFLDGRDVSQQSSAKYIKMLNEKISQIGLGVIASLGGRYYGMDRDNNLNRTIKAYDSIVLLKGNSFIDPINYIQEEYVRLRNESWEQSDEFIASAYNKNLKEGLKNNDAVIFLNFRPDRAIQLSTLITNSSFYKEKISIGQLNNIYFVSMMKYADSVKGEVAFELDKLDNLFGEILAKRGYSQLRLAETEKYAHVTYFFDGMKKYDGVELPQLENCKRILVNSPKVATYDLKPEMSAYEVTDNLLNEINKNIHDVIIVNYANCDMVGHTAVYKAVIKAVEVVDECVGKVYQECLKNGYTLIVTADHGNADMVFDLDNNLITSHTLSRVPFLVTKKNIILQEGKLADISPTILGLLGEEKPVKMTGKNLILQKEEN